MFEVKYFSGLLLIVMGSMDCLTTVLGTLYFGAQELNPLIEGIVLHYKPAFFRNFKIDGDSIFWVSFHFCRKNPS